MCEQSKDNFDLLEIMIILAKKKRQLIGVPLIVGLIATAISFALPNVYQATTKLLPPQQSQSSAAALLSQLGGVAGLAAGAAGVKTPNDLYVGMLKSRTIADKLIKTFNLKKSYDADTQEKTRQILEKNTNIIAGKDGLITIDVEDKDQKVVARIANAYVEELIKLSKELALTEASQRRLFFERQLEQSKDRLAGAEVTLKRSMDTRGVISVDADSRAIVETVGRLRAQISAKQIQLNSMGTVVTENNPAYRRAQSELSSLQAELSKLENGRGSRQEETGMPGNQSGLENIKVLRDVKYYQMLYELLAKQYEAARLDEAKDPAIIQVLDTAIEPEKKAKPKRLIIVLVCIAVAFFATAFFVFTSEAKRRLKMRPGGEAQLAELSANLKF
ncbi:lipopolysaccharide biosynthesis protein [Massilia forsythiae]|uniref:Lipopolysaccharide biosynthesis protein n=2 Tax=Massilia forsythiae TaxID=2728020 RepID=A0A7Z2W1J5_9BURK|nr:lipopolysaccharide biosynthesis protein [Massilia forsythiae]